MRQKRQFDRNIEVKKEHYRMLYKRQRQRDKRKGIKRAFLGDKQNKGMEC